MQSVQINLTKDELLSKFELLENLLEVDNIEDEVSSNLIEITYSELRTLRNNSQLVPGAWYRITDYKTTVSEDYKEKHSYGEFFYNNLSYEVAVAGDEETDLVYRLFDVLVLALSNNTLSEEARAINHVGDDSFKNSKVEAWKLWYCIDNDPYRFAWADVANGKGVIYRMIDEGQNDVPYDFKNIVYRIPLTEYNAGTPKGYNNPFEYSLIYDYTNNSNKSYYYVYTFALGLTEEFKEMLLSDFDIDVDDEVFILDSSTPLIYKTTISLGNDGEYGYNGSTTPNIEETLVFNYSRHNVIKESVLNHYGDNSNEDSDSITYRYDFGPVQYLNNNIILSYFSSNCGDNEDTGSHCVSIDNDSPGNIVMGKCITIGKDCSSNVVISINGPVKIEDRSTCNYIIGGTGVIVGNASNYNFIAYSSLEDAGYSDTVADSSAGVDEYNLAEHGYSDNPGLVQIGNYSDYNSIYNSTCVTIGNDSHNNVIGEEFDLQVYYYSSIYDTLRCITIGNHCNSNELNGAQLLLLDGCMNNVISGERLYVMPFTCLVEVYDEKNLTIYSTPDQSDEGE